MGQLSGTIPVFAKLYEHPDIDRMLGELSHHEFEHFVKYVFEQAGYTVKDVAGQHNTSSGLDLEIYCAPAGTPMLHAGVQVKHWRRERKITSPYMVSLRGGLPENTSVTGYFVTTSSFKDTALNEAQSEGKRRLWPLDGEHFVRYINYLRGSRLLSQEAADDIATEPLLDDPLVPISPTALFLADNIVRRPPTKTKVLTLANHKGGVGKTTSAINIAFGLMAQGYQVLLIDMDAQANLTKVISSGKTPALHLGEYFAHKRPLADLVHPTQFPLLWLIPSNQALALVDRGTTAGPGALLRFARDLHAPTLQPPHILNTQDFDWIIIDTGPSMGFFTRSALAASHYVVMPVAPGPFSEVGVNFLRDTASTIAALTGEALKILGCIVTNWKTDAINQQFIAPIAASLGILGPPIPVDKYIDKAHLEVGSDKSKPKILFNYKSSAAAKAYTAVIDEVIRRVK
jgi:chromosome partitioning protein